MVIVLESLAIGVGALSIIPYVSIIGYLYRFRVVNVFLYKYRKKVLYAGVEEALKNKDIQSLRDFLDLLKYFDTKYDRKKCQKIKQKYGITDEILDSRKLFRLKFDTDYLIENQDNIIISDKEIINREKDILKRELSLDNLENNNDTKKIFILEKNLRNKEIELEKREKEIIEIISNLNKL